MCTRSWSYELRLHTLTLCRADSLVFRLLLFWPRKDNAAFKYNDFDLDLSTIVQKVPELQLEAYVFIYNVIF